MFESIYSQELRDYFSLRARTLGESGLKHEACYLSRFDSFLRARAKSRGQISERLMSEWVSTLRGKSSSIENEVIVIRQFLSFLKLGGENAFIPAIPKVRDDYVPYLFDDRELGMLFESADNLRIASPRSDPLLAVEFPVILRLLLSCGLRIGETLAIRIRHVDLENGILRLMKAKNRKQRIVPMSGGMASILLRYCMAMGLMGNREGWLFPSSAGSGPASHASVKGLFKRLLGENGIRLASRRKHERGPCLHCMRHVFAFKSFAKAEGEGRSLDEAIPFLSVYLGHDSLDETMKYLKFSSEMFPGAVSAFGEYIDGVLPGAGNG